MGAYQGKEPRSSVGEKIILLSTSRRNTVGFLFKVEQGLAVFTENGISTDGFLPTDQPEDCVYDTDPSCSDIFPDPH